MGQLLMKIHVELAGQCTFPSAGEDMPNGIESLGDFGTMSGSAENSFKGCSTRSLDAIWGFVSVRPVDDTASLAGASEDLPSGE